MLKQLLTDLYNLFNLKNTYENIFEFNVYFNEDDEYCGDTIINIYDSGYENNYNYTDNGIEILNLV